jgi:lipopolysaccharide export system protein LptA
MADLPRPVLARSSPAIRASQFRRLVLILCGILLAAALLVVFLNLDGPGGEQAALRDEPPEEEIEEYHPLPIDGDGEGRAASSQGPEVIFESGAWVEFADEAGQLVQKYRADHMEPLADGLIDLLNPVAVMFLSQGRVLTIEGNFCRAKRRSDNDIIETGRISGDVRIRMFEPNGDSPPSYTTDSPSVYIETEDAEFDNLSGEIVCTGEVMVRTDTFEFFGRHLVARYDDENGLQYLRTDETVRPIRIAATSVESADSKGPRSEVAEGAVEVVWPGAARASQDGADRAGQDPQRRRRERPGSSASDEMQLYRATFEINVHIWRGHEMESLAPQVVLGDELRAIFTMEHSRLGEEESAISAQPMNWHGDFNWRAMVATAALAATQESSQDDRDAIMPPPSPDDLHITHDGPLTIVPIDDSTIVLADEDDLYLEIPGAPATLIDREADSVATSGLITYQASSDQAVLHSDAARSLHIESPELVADGDRFEYGFSTDLGAFVGPGTMRLYRRPDESGEDAAPSPVERMPALAMAWTDRVDLRMTPRGEDGESSRESRLEEAVFTGQVSAVEDRFAMKSDRLKVDFDTESAERDQIEFIESNGAVDVQGLDERGGRMHSHDMRIDFEPDESGQRRASRMTALGDAHLEDSTQRIDAQKIVAHLSPTPTAAVDGGTGRFGDVEVTLFEAEQEVRIALENGTRATGDRFVARPLEDLADLYGAPVVVDGGEDDVEFHAEGAHVHVEREDDGRHKLTMPAAIATITNHGAVRGFETLAGAPADGGAGEVAVASPPAAPMAASPQVINATCSDRLEYLEGNEVDPDLVELYGTVRAHSTAPLEDSSIESEYLRLDFADEPAEAADGAEGNVTGEAGAPPATRRVLKRMVAKGDAQLESRSWLGLDRAESGLRIVYISGDHVEYDQSTMTVDVPGPGQLLILDRRVDDSSGGAPVAGDKGAKFEGLTGKGTTLFDWQGSMRMRELEEGLFSMRMEQRVVMRFDSLAGPDGDASLTTQALDVTFGRRGPEEQAAALDFGGAMEIRTFEAVGAAHLDAMGRSIDGQRIHYDVMAQIVEIEGSPARPAEILVEGQAIPQRAEKFIWDLRQDKVTIIRVAGGAGR